jgi:hypothetical protein
VEGPETEAQSYPIIVRSFEPVADLDDRLQRIFTVLSLPPLEELSAQRPCLTRCASRVTSDVAESPSEPPLGMPSGVWGTKIRVAPRESRDLQVGLSARLGIKPAARSPSSSKVPTVGADNSVSPAQEPIRLGGGDGSTMRKRGSLPQPWDSWAGRDRVWPPRGSDRCSAAD